MATRGDFCWPRVGSATGRLWGGSHGRRHQEQVGHRCDTSTAIYTHVSGDFMNTALRQALSPVLEGERPG